MPVKDPGCGVEGVKLGQRSSQRPPWRLKHEFYFERRASGPKFTFQKFSKKSQNNVDARSAKIVCVWGGGRNGLHQFWWGKGLTPRPLDPRGRCSWLQPRAGEECN